MLVYEVRMYDSMGRPDFESWVELGDPVHVDAYDSGSAAVKGAGKTGRRALIPVGSKSLEGTNKETWYYKDPGTDIIYAATPIGPDTSIAQEATPTFTRYGKDLTSGRFWPVESE